MVTTLTSNTFRAACFSLLRTRTWVANSKSFKSGFDRLSRRTGIYGQFVLRAALYEYDKLVRDGMSKETFEITREFLSKYVNVLTATQDAQLGYALDSRYYRIADFPTYMREQLAKLTLDDVNRAIRQHLKSGAMRIAIVTKDGNGLREAILSNKASPITYNAPKPKEITDEDKIIEAYKITVKPGDVMIVPVDRVFQ